MCFKILKNRLIYTLELTTVATAGLKNLISPTLLIESSSRGRNEPENLFSCGSRMSLFSFVFGEALRCRTT